ncbi:NUDIX hydrolase [Natronobiforma cellulositropha]|uniref:NUDIX hydrolase n=1 Tax=Natronobiforma cellulositropha TaxID=1679076 RepID=UPI0021D56AE0|nr:NUDIX domain-containing protein [Natronobiforma cellulositropha]
MTFDELTMRADDATRRAADVYRRLERRYDGFLEREHSRSVSRQRFSTLVTRIRQTGAPFGAQTIVYRPSGDLLLVRHEGVDQWVLPGGGVDADESFLETARRELEEEAGISADYDGLAIATRIDFDAHGYRTWGVLPIFAARATETVPEVSDPDGEISAARWFSSLPDDTQDRADVLAWREAHFG